MSRSLRSERVPVNTIIFTGDSLVPPGYTHISALDCKLAKGVASCICPGCNVGNANHTHTSDSHTHASCPTVSGPHSHPSAATGGTIPADRAGSSGPVVNRLPGPHQHTSVANTNPGASIIIANDSGHTHDVISNDPSFKTARHIKHTATSFGLRKQTLPSLGLLIWPKSTTIPIGFSGDTRFDTFYARGSTTVLTTGGANTHQHNSVGSLSHALSVGTHPHPASAAAPNTAAGPSGNQATAVQAAQCPHSHPVGSLAFSSCPIGGGATSPSAGAHTHDDLDNEPAHYNARMIITSLNMRVKGIPNGVVSVWEDTLASIPSGFQLADATNGTSDLRTFTPKFQTSDIGCTAGANAHTHSSDSAHTHTSTVIPHTHQSTGTSGVGSTTSTFPTTNSGTTHAIQGHTHSGGVAPSTGATVPVTLDSAGGHTHGSQCHIPLSRTVAFIERLV